MLFCFKDPNICFLLASGFCRLRCTQFVRSSLHLLYELETYFLNKRQDQDSNHWDPKPEKGKISTRIKGAGNTV